MGRARVMTVHKLSAGDGYTYLTRQVASGDTLRSPGHELADYYLSTGNPAGRWVGGGAADLGVSDDPAHHQRSNNFSHTILGVIAYDRAYR